MPKQRGVNDCVIAAVANATGNSYATVKKRFGHIDRGGVLRHEMEWLLGCYGHWRIRHTKRKLSDWVKAVPLGRHVVWLNSSLLGEKGHVVAVVNGQVVGDYSPDWPIIRVYTQTPEGT